MEAHTVIEFGGDEGLDDPMFDDLFSALRTVGSGTAPVISDELRMVMTGAATTARARRRRTLIRFGAAGLASAGVVAGGLTAAAANDLPAPVQRVVSVVVGTLTPFDVPNPDQQGPVENQQDGPADSPGDQPGQDSPSPGTTADPDEQGGQSGQNGDLDTDEPNGGGATDGGATDGAQVNQQGANQGAGEGSNGDEPDTSSSVGHSVGQTNTSQGRDTDDGPSGSNQPSGTDAGNGDDGAVGSGTNGNGDGDG